MRVVRNPQQPLQLEHVPEEAQWLTEGGNPRAAAFKQQEMSVKRAYLLNSGLIEALAQAGDYRTLVESRAWAIVSSKELKEALSLGNYGKEDPACHSQEVWEWVLEHWYSGALRRSVIATMDNLTEANRKTIKDKVSDLYG